MKQPGGRVAVLVWAALVFVLLGAPVQFACAQATTAAKLEKAQALAAAKDFAGAAALYRQIVEQEPGNGRAWYALGQALHLQGQYAEAVEAYMKADELYFLPPRTRYNLACAYAMGGNKNMALRTLEQAVSAGFSQVQLLQTDSDLASLREAPQFDAIVEAADRKARPCEYDPKYREFDFWIGEWEVFNPQGQKVGENVIRKTTNGCMLLENWTSAFGGVGKSMNFYDAAEKKWKQVWINGTGGISPYEGQFTEGAMRFAGYQIQPDGQKYLFKMAFTPNADGSVRQYIEQSTDSGTTWAVWFDGVYKKKAVTGKE